LSLVVGTVAFTVAGASANVPLTQVSTDPFTNPTSQHKTEVEPDTFAFGSAIVGTFQTGRFTDGGASDIGWATSTNGGQSWQHGFLPGITKYQGNGPYDRVSDPAVAYDAKHGVWLISSLAITEPVRGAAVLTSRSSDGLNWANPVTVGTGAFTDKEWIACDNTSSSPHYGNCYTEWDDAGQGDVVKMSTSSDGGQTWGAAKSPADHATGLGGQPVVDQKGRVIVPFWSDAGSIEFFTSKNGGGSWSATKFVANITDHNVFGLRTEPLPTAEVDKKGTVYIVWQDCRFRSGCSSNDLVMATIKKAKKVTPVVRIPIDPTSSTVDHFIPGLAVDRTSSGKQARLGLVYYYYPVASCNFTTCDLDVGYVSSTNGGATWTAPLQLAGPMKLTWLANAGGRFVGDYISSSFVNDKVLSVFAVANPPNGSVFDEAMYAPATGLPVVSGSLSGAGDRPVPNAQSDHPPYTLTPIN
jgi:hypothetical protein